ncbi:MAG: hypothetical protein KAI39_04290 [Desulfobulbaceae bacterium]|nr:hypothetical protein [Desulfobulbaceae bacterium]
MPVNFNAAIKITRTINYNFNDIVFLLLDQISYFTYRLSHSGATINQKFFFSRLLRGLIFTACEKKAGNQEYNEEATGMKLFEMHVHLIYESVDLIAFLFDVEANGKFYRRHIVDIPRIKFFI